MWAIVGSNLYCPLLNSKSSLMCIVGKQQKDHKPRSLNYCFFANQRVLFFAMPFLHYKGFALTGHLKTAKCECLWSSRTGSSSSYLLLKIKQFCSSLNRQLSTWCSNSHLFFIHITLPCIQKCFTLTGHLKSAKNECLWSIIEKTAEALTCCRKKYLYSSKIRPNLYMICFTSVKKFLSNYLCTLQ